MPVPFRAETRAVLRRRVGTLLAPADFHYGPVLAATLTSVTTAFARRLTTGSLKGRVLVVTSGLGAGQQVSVTDSTLGTGEIIVSPTWGVTPDTTSMVEVWPEGLDPERVNDALNLAVLAGAELVNLREDLTSPTLDPERTVVTPPVGWTYVVDLLYREDTGLWRRYVPTQFDGYWVPAEYEYTVLAGKLYLSYPIPANIGGPDILLRGYRHPQTLDTDTDTCEVNPDYLIYAAAMDLDSGLAEGPQLDPEAHAVRANAWLRAMLVARSKLGTDWESTTVRIRP